MSLHIYPKSRMNCNGNCGFEAVMVYQCRFLHCTICATLMGCVDDGGDYACVSTGDIQITCKCKTL